jgi:hypothetical protein
MAGRPKKKGTEKLVSVGLAILPEIDAEIGKFLETDGRLKGQFLRQIFMRGWAAYKRDGLLVEPVANTEEELEAASKLTQGKKGSRGGTGSRNSGTRKR